MFEKSDDDLSIKYCQPEIRSPTPVDEEYLTISSTSFAPLSHVGDSEVGSTLEPDGLGPTSVSLPGKQCTSDDEWEDLEEVERDMKEQQDIGVCDSAAVSTIHVEHILPVLSGKMCLQTGEKHY